ncbi:hypothetical protein [Rheinheimera nanhaiensis]|uniref:DUF3828 domain-containing protein n=1 Tax=Rheinheimera nanhaiensis E407-8 TaxID=562729 RepID=I1E1Y8_9GAMM|nr:hypothetical protein [Rheinheimera nanhaiensis]GAB60316.1 hypothetical protein RNAN_3338 [Rheinheimera nanhaiensis E407-8]
MTLRWLLPLMLLLTACTDEAPKVNAQWGTPEYIATQFFHALYNEKDLEQAKALSTPEYAALMDSYGTVRQVGRTLMNMSFDTVEIRVNRSGGNLREQYEDAAAIDILLTGPHGGKQVDELRTVELVRSGNRWVVKTVQVDKFSSSAR